MNAFNCKFSVPVKDIKLCVSKNIFENKIKINKNVYSKHLLKYFQKKSFRNKLLALMKIF
jgi:hypothetical protein